MGRACRRTGSGQLRSVLVVIEPECSGANYCLVYHPHSYILNTLAGDMEILYYEPSGSPDTSQDLYLLRLSSVH